MTRIAGDWLTAPATRAVFAALAQGGHQVFAVGGCVRNALLGQPVSDVDLATDARPDRVMELARAAGLKPVPTGIAHGTVTVVAEGQGFEVTTFRRDVRTDGRRAVVAFADSIEDDAHRRDFTINALYCDAEGRVLDPLGTGLSDLAQRRVRFIDDAATRIREDALRILRFFRFHAWYGDPEGGIDADALDACARLADLVTGLSRERVGAEMLKLLAAPDPAPALAAMERTGVLARLLPGASSAAVAPLVHLEGRFGLSPDPIRRLAALGGQDVARALRLSRADARRLALLTDTAPRPPGIAELGWRHGAGTALDIALLHAALTGALPPEDAPQQAALGAGQRFPVRAADLDPALKGPAIGRRLRQLERAWIDSGFRLDREALLALPPDDDTGPRA